MFKKDLNKTLSEVIKILYVNTGLLDFNKIGDVIEIKNSHNIKEVNSGDFSTPVALSLANGLNKKPQEVAEEIKKEIEETDFYKKNKEHISKIEIAGPGFINLYLTDKGINSLLEEIKNISENGLKVLTEKKYNIEFISANPTGKLHIGHGRGAFYGDVLSNILEFLGAKIDREFYINNSKESKQIKELGKTALGNGEQYKTEDLEEKIKNMNFQELDEEEAGFKLAETIQENNKNFITKDLGIKFDNWYSEDEKLRASKINDQTLNFLEEKNLAYDRDGAVWLKTSEYGDDEDRVIIRSDGSKSYFLSDISYHQDKFNRGYDKIINIWGADHHGHVKRMKAVKEMFKWEGELQIFITQLVSLKEGKEVQKMSKRAGNVILLEDLVSELGLDVVRWFFIEKSLNTHMEFNLELARQQSAKNPVYYVQYAHARIYSILEKTKGLKKIDKNISNKPATKSLIMKLYEFNNILENITAHHQINNLTTYVYELAGEFSTFYHEVRVIENDIYNKKAVELIKITQKVMAKSLKLLGISTPKKM